MLIIRLIWRLNELCSTTIISGRSWINFDLYWKIGNIAFFLIILLQNFVHRKSHNLSILNVCSIDEHIDYTYIKMNRKMWRTPWLIWPIFFLKSSLKFKDGFSDKKNSNNRRKNPENSPFSFSLGGMMRFRVKVSKFPCI